MDPLKAKNGNASKRAGTSGNKTAKTGSEGNKGTQNTAKEDCQAGNYLLLVRLRDTCAPRISRLLCVPPETTFEKFHEVLQIAFGWAGCHMHTFEIQEQDPDNPYYGKTVLYLQADPEKFGMGIEPEPEEEGKYSLADVFEKEEWKGKIEMTYEYDMGDSWEHEITLLGRADAHLGESMSFNETGQRIAVLAWRGSCLRRRLWWPYGVAGFEGRVQENQRRRYGAEGVVQTHVCQRRPQGTRPLQVGHVGH